MSFLVPLFLLGTLAAAGPVVFHLVRRATRNRVMFSNMRLLDQSNPRLNRRSRIQHPWLLALRCLIIAVLATGFARPFLKSDTLFPAGASARNHTVVVLDASASMQREGVWEEATQRVAELAGNAGPLDSFALITAGSASSVTVSAESWDSTQAARRAQLLDAVLDDARPEWSTSRLDVAIDLALEELASMEIASGPASSQKIHVVSDLAAGTKISGLAGRTWPEKCTVGLDEIAGTSRENVSVHWLGWSEQPGSNRSVRLKIANSGETMASVRLEVDDLAGETSLIKPRNEEVAPGETRLVRVEIPDTASGPFRATISGDTHPFDNSVWFLAPTIREIHVPIFGGGTLDDPAAAAYYLSRASAGWRDPIVTWVPLATSAESAAGQTPFAVVAGAVNADAIRAQVSSGGTALILINGRNVLATAASIVGEPLELKEAPTASDAMFGRIDFTHELFEPFADPRFSDFTRIRFWEATPLRLPPDSDARPLAVFDGGGVAVAEYNIGAGKTVLWAGDWTPAASQWVLSTKFVPWLHTLVERAAGGPRRPNMHVAGDPTLFDQDYRPLHVMAGTNGPGVFQLDPEGDVNSRDRFIAVNTPESESDLAPLPLDAWEALGIPISAGIPGLQAESPPSTPAGSPVDLEAKQSLWRWLLLSALILLAIESCIAWRLARSSPSSLPAANRAGAS